MNKKEMYLKALKSVKTIINAMYDLENCYMEDVETYQLMNDLDNYPFDQSLDEVIARVVEFEETIEDKIGGKE